MTRRFSVDTNILVYAADRAAGSRHLAAVELMDKAIDADCVLLAQTLAEFFRASTRKSIVHAPDAAAFVRGWMAGYEVRAWSPADLEAAMALTLKHRVAFFDALLIATAARAGCAVLLSEDMQHAGRIGGVEIVNPFLPAARPILASLLVAGR